MKIIRVIYTADTIYEKHKSSEITKNNQGKIRPKHHLDNVPADKLY